MIADNSNAQINVLKSQININNSQNALPINSNSIQIDPHLKNLREEVKNLQEKVSVIYEQLARQNDLEMEIQMLQGHLKEYYDKLRKLAHQYGELSANYKYKVENTTDDIYDQRDRGQSNVYFLEKEKKRLEQGCREKKIIRDKLKQQIISYEDRRANVSGIIEGQNFKLQTMVQSNKVIEEQMKFTRQQIQILQIQIYNQEHQDQNLSKDDYELTPQRVQAMTKQRDRLLQQLNNAYNMRKQKVNDGEKLIKIEQYQRIAASLSAQQKRYDQVKQIPALNNQLSAEIAKLTQMKDLFDERPNSQLQKLQQNMRNWIKKIVNIEKDIYYLKKKGIELTQKLRDFTEYDEKQKQNQQQQIYQPILQSIPPKQKIKNEKQTLIKKSILQLISDYFYRSKISVMNLSNNLSNYKRILLLGNQEQIKQVIVKQYSYKLIKRPQKNIIIIVVIIIIIFAYFTCKDFKK